MAEPIRGTMPANAVAIVGLAGRFPGADDLDAFWRNIAGGVEALTVFSDADLDAANVPAALRDRASYVRSGTTLDEAELFDAAFFGVSPREAQILDPQHRVFLECAWEALEHAGYAVGDLPEAVGVYAGASMNSYVYARLMQNPALLASAGGYQIMLGNDKDFLSTRVSYKLDLRGPSIGIQTACSTSLVAVHAACRALQRGECDMALAGGVSLTFPMRSGYLYQEGMILSPDGHCRPFDADARGTRPGAGAGIVVLKLLSDALAAGDSVYAVIRGIAVNNDGAAKAGFTAPSIDGQVEVIATAQALAGVSPRSISYVEAHGTATPLGDPIEIAALTRAFRAGTDEVGYCRLGSLKANLGHLDAAAGVAGLIKTVLALKHRALPPLVNFRSANPALQLDSSPFTASAAGSHWEQDGETPRRAGVSSFGIGGTNAHAVLEEAPADTVRAASTAPQLLLLSARSAASLDMATTRLADHLAAHPDQDLADVAWTLQRGRVAFMHRRALVAADAVQAVAALRAPEAPPIMAGRHEGGIRRVAFLFSGQGSQYAGMGRGLYATQPVYREAVDECAALLQPLLGDDIRHHLHTDTSANALDQTRLTQPALFVVEYALARQWQHWGVVPAAMMGHSLGEYVAAHLAGVMSLPDVLAVVAARGRLMQQQAPGGMAAVRLSAGELAAWLGPEVEIAAVNAPGLCTVAGPSDAIADLLGRLTAVNVEARALRTSHAFHSAMMEPALAEFTAVVDRIPLMAPAVPYVSNLTGTWITPQQATSPAYYAAHLRRPVRFEEGMRTLAAEAELHFLEVGPGTALTSLARMNLGTSGARRVVASMRREADAQHDDHALLEAAGRLWLAGGALDWQALHGDERRRVALPTYAFERQRYTVEPEVQARPAADVPTRAGRRSSNVDEWCYAPTWSRDDQVPAAGDGTTWLVLGDAGAVTDAVCASLSDRGLDPVRVERGAAFERRSAYHWVVRPGHADDLTALMRAGPGNGTRLGGAIHLWCLPVQAGEARVPMAADDGYAVLVALASATSESGALPLRVLHATAGAHSVLDEPVIDHRAALAHGPALVLPTEVPGLTMRSVDLARQDDGVDVARAADALSAEACLTGIEPLVGWRLGRRWVRRYERLALPAGASQAPPFKHEGVYLITGGVGGMGLAIARWLGHTQQARLLLTARTPLPPRPTWDAWLEAHPQQSPTAAAMQAIRDIESSGGEVLVAAADVADEAAMAAAIAAARQRWGAIDGVIHAAGIAGTGRIAQLAAATDAQAVFGPKVQGLDVLARTLGAQPLDVVVLMGSVNAVVGAPGACDYSAANAVLDAFVDSVARPQAWRQVVVIDWGAWRDVGMAAKLQVAGALRAQWEAHLAGAILPAAGIDALQRVLASGRRRVVVDTYDLMHATESLRRPPAANRAGDVNDTDRTTEAVPVPTSAPPVRSSGSAAPSTDDVHSRLLSIWVELLGVDGAGIDDDFFALGGHSLLATRVLSRIEETLGARLTLRELFDAPTVRQLAAKIAPRTDGPTAGLIVEVDGGNPRVSPGAGSPDVAAPVVISADVGAPVDVPSTRSPAGSAGAPIAPAAPGRDLPLSYFQERLWALHELDPASTAFNLVACWPAPLTVDVERVVSAIETVTLRHGALRATFVDLDGVPGVRLRDLPAPRPAVVDLRAVDPTEQRRLIESAVATAAQRPYVLAAEAPAHFTLFRITDAQSYVMLAAHHIALDAWSATLVRREVEALCAGESLPPVLQYQDFAAWQRRAQGVDTVQAELNWWAATLDGAPPSSTFATDRESPEAPTAGVVEFGWDAELSAGVRAMAAEAGATVYMTMVAACASVLRAHTRQSDIVLGNPTGVRERPELETVVGPFVNVQPLRLKMGDDPGFGELLRRTRAVCLDAHEHREVPLELLLERLKPPRTADHAPLFQVAVVQHNATPHDDLVIAGGGAMHELTWYFREVDGRIVGAFEYRADMFSAAAIERIASQLKTLLQSAIADRARPVSTLSLLTPDARQQVLQEFNRSAIPVETALFARQFERQTALHPQRIAVAFAGQVLTYAALNRRANRLARRLRLAGVGPGVLVGICLERSLDLLVALVGVQKAGGAYVPLDTDFPVERLDFMLQDSGAPVLITSGAAASQIHRPDGMLVIDPTSHASGTAADGQNLEPVGTADDPAYAIYTSGSTGRPKGVVVSHAALANFLGAMRREPGLSESDVLAAVTTVSFDIAALELYLPLVVGARIELITRDTASDDVALIAHLDASGATVLQATPATWRMLVDANWRPVRPVRAFCGGETLPRDLADHLLERVQELVNLYGPTETTVWSTLERVRPAPAPITIGTPIANTRVYVVDPHGEPVPIGVAGELWIGGAGVALGYHARPELTAERFIADPFSTEPGARVFRTGDAAMWDGEGRLHHLGRLDHQLKIRGFRIEPGEIEAALEAHPAVRQAVVTGRNATPNDVRLIAYLVFQTAETLTTSEVRNHLRASLPAYMIPSVVMTIDAIPMTPNGKVDRALLPDPFRNTGTSAEAFVAPAPGAEATMAAIWGQVLHVERIGAEDSFFELGGHSLLALRVAAAVEKQLGVRIDPRTLFFRNLRQVTAALTGATKRPD